MPPMGTDGNPSRIYSATYSHVPVYELMVDGDQIMRRRSDDYVNATHILKAAQFDKPARTRILEREVQKGIHEKVQGGYGKYQGTWIPLDDARSLAEKNGVYERIKEIIEYVPGPHSPPPAPKHATAASNKPKAPRQAAARRVPGQSKQQPGRKSNGTNNLANPVSSGHRMSEISCDNYSTRDTPDHASMRSQTPMEYMDPGSRYSSQGQRKRKRGTDEPVQMSQEERIHIMWTDELLDYFMLQGDSDPLPGPPEPPPSVDLDRPVDDKGHTPMHWAAAMGDLKVVSELIQRGAQVDTPAVNGETPLMRAVLFTNNYDKRSMDQLVQILIHTVPVKDLCASTVFHHITATTCSKTKYTCARYYLETILKEMEGAYAQSHIAQMLNEQDQHGDTAVLIAARYGARKCLRLLLQYGASTEIPNTSGETARALIDALNARRRERHGDSGNMLSSSPVRDIAGGHHYGESMNDIRNANGAMQTSSKKARTSYRSEAANLLSSQLGVLITSRAEQLAAEIEKEVSDREAEVAENARVLEARREEVDRLRDECDRLLLVEKSETSPDHKGDSTTLTQDADHAASEIQRLESEVRQLLQSAQSATLGRLVDEASRISPRNNGQPATDHIAVSRALLTQQTRHRTLVDQIVATAGLASDASSSLAILTNSHASHTPPLRGERRGDDAASDSKRAQYTRLIRSALNIPPGEDAEIEDLLPDILKDLEEARRERDDVADERAAGRALVGGVEALGGADVSMLDVGGVGYGVNGHGRGGYPVGVMGCVA